MRVRKKPGFDIFRLLLIALPCLFFFPELAGFSMFAGWDVTRLNLPLKWHDVQSIRDGALPLWNHYLYSGMPHLAESESGLFYPGNLLMHLPGNFFYWAGITYILHFVLAGLFMDLWLRGRGIKPFFSFFGAVLFQTAPFLLFHITSMALLQSVVWFPLLLWLADRFLETTGPGRRLILGFIALLGGMLILIGSAQMAFYQGFLVFWYLVGQVFSRKEGRSGRVWKSIWFMVGLVAGMGLIGAVIWIPAMEFSGGTVREIVGKEFYRLGSNWLTPIRLVSAYFFSAYSRQTEVVGWASSLIYIGFLPAFFSVFRIFGIRSNWRKDAGLIVMGFVALVLAFGMNNPINHLLISFPPFSMFRYQGRMAIGVLVALIVLSCHCLEMWSEQVGSKNIQIDKAKKGSADFKVPYLAAISLLIFGLFVFLVTSEVSNAITIGLRVLIIDLVLFLAAILIMQMSRSGKVIKSWLLIYLVFHLVIVFPVGRLATMYTDDFDESMAFFDLVKRADNQPARLLVVDAGRFADRDLLEFNRWTPQNELPNFCAGNSGIFAGVQTMDPYTPLRPVEWHWMIRDQIGTGFRNVEETGMLDEGTSDALEFLGIDAVVTSGRVIQIPGYRLYSSEKVEKAFGQHARLYLSDDESPRVWAEGPDGDDKIPLSNLEFGPNRAGTDISTPYPEVVVELSYDPNWVVKVDGESANVIPHGDVFYSIETGTGEHTIEFIYRPRSVKIGGTISIISLVLLIGWLLFSFPWKHCAYILPGTRN